MSAWQDEDGDWIETGLHIFFGAYPNMMNLFAELDIEDRLQWKVHKMIFAMQELPGEFTTFDFVPGIPAPFNFGLAILLNQKMLTLGEKIQTAPPLLPMLIEGQDFIDEQDELSVLDFMRKYGMPERINEEVFISMAKALDFIDPDKLSMTVVLTAMNRFLNEDDGLQMAFLDGNQPDRLCAPMAAHIEARGGEVRDSSARQGDRDSTTTARSSRPEDALGRRRSWRTMYISAVARRHRQAHDAAGVAEPCRSSTSSRARGHPRDQHSPLVRPQAGQRRPPLLLALAAALGVRGHVHDVQGVLRRGEVDARARVRAVLAHRRRQDVNWIAKSDEEIVDATMGELARLFPDSRFANAEVAGDGVARAGEAAQARGGQACRARCTPRFPAATSTAPPRRRPSQLRPGRRLDEQQKFLGSMEGAVLAGKLAAEVVTDKAVYGAPTKGLKKIVPDVIEEAKGLKEKEPVGADEGESALVFGAGAVMGEAEEKELLAIDPEQMVKLEGAPAR